MSFVPGPIYRLRSVIMPGNSDTILSAMSDELDIMSTQDETDLLLLLNSTTSDADQMYIQQLYFKRQDEMSSLQTSVTDARDNLPEE